jgi:4-hydroxybenzoate polyprenyltransferase
VRISHSSDPVMTFIASEFSAPMARKPLCVDLDGTLLRIDSFMESILSLVRRRPQAIPQLLTLLLTERLKAKAMTAHDFPFTEATPLNQGVVEMLRRERASGRYLVLATGAHEVIAERVRVELQLFDEVLASNGTCNLTGQRKLDALETRFGRGGFEYIGNSVDDVPVWRSCGSAIVAEPSLVARIALRILRLPTEEIGPLDPKPRWRVITRCVRVHQWSKNILVLVPLLLSHKIMEWWRLLAASEAALAFCFIASGVYLVNDLLDLEADRKHPEKKSRPLARGDCSVVTALALASACFVVGTLIAAKVSIALAGFMGIYLLTAAAYSLRLKRFPLIDIFMLILFYCARILAGALAADVLISPWLIQFMLFCFLSLSAGKRVAELLMSRSSGEDFEGRGYRREDLDLLTVFGIVAGFLSVLIVALYVNSPEVVQLYRHPYTLWMLCPMLLYWFSRLWMTIRRDELKGDPVMFAFHDRATWAVGAIALAVYVAAL